MCRIFSDAVFCAMYCSAFVRRFQLNFNIFNKDELFHPHQCVLPVFLCHGHCSIELWQHNASPICVINEPKAWFEIFLPWPLVQCAPQTHLEVVIKDKMQDSMGWSSQIRRLQFQCLQMAALLFHCCCSAFSLWEPVSCVCKGYFSVWLYLTGSPLV